MRISTEHGAARTPCEHADTIVSARSTDRDRPAVPTSRHIPFMLLALWFGLLTGLAQVAVWTIQTLLHKTTHRGPDVVWMAPLAAASFLLLSACLFDLAAARWPKLLPWRRGVFVYSLVGYLNVILMYPHVHWAAAVLLSMGLAT